MIIPVSTCIDGIILPDPLCPLSEDSDLSANLTFLLEIAPYPALPPRPVRLGLCSEDAAGEEDTGEEVMRGEEEPAARGGGGGERNSAESWCSCLEKQTDQYRQTNRHIHK